MLNMVSFAFHFMHVPAIGFQWGGSGDRLGSSAAFTSFIIISSLSVTLAGITITCPIRKFSAPARDLPGRCVVRLLHSVVSACTRFHLTGWYGTSAVPFRCSFVESSNVSPVLIFWSLPVFILTMSPVVTLYMLAME